MEAAYDITQMAYDGEQGRAFSQDEKLFVHFYMGSRPNKAKTKEEGRPIFEPCEFVRIIVPGDKNNIVNRPVWSQDKQRFPKQYAAFKNNEEQQSAGTPLESVPWITREQVEEMKFFHVRTLEQLANMPDSNAQKFMGVNTLRQKARDAIQYAKEQAPIQALAEARRENAELMALVKQLTERVAALEDEDEEE